MSFTRRDFLHASTVIGTIVLLSPIFKASQITQKLGLSPSSRTVKILRGSAAHAEFEAGVRLSLDAHGSHNLSSISGFMETPFDDFDQLKRHLEGAEGTAVIGLMKDSESIFFNEAVRDIGGSILCHGSHVDTGTFSRHEFVSTPASSGIGSVFGQNLAHGKYSALIQEATLHANASPLFEPATDIHQDGWSWHQFLGYFLAQVASGSWSMASVKSRILIGTESHLPATGTSFVSLVALI